MQRILVGLVMAAVGLTGCSGGSGSKGDSSQDSGEFASAQAIIDAAQAKGLACTSTEDDNGELFTRDGWRCTTDNGDAVTAHTFGDNSNRDNWLEAAKKFGGNFVVGDRWAVDADSPALAQTVQSAVGGTIQ
jgi:hypothetical protein